MDELKPDKYTYNVLKNGDNTQPGHADAKLYFCFYGLGSADEDISVQDYSTGNIGPGETGAFSWMVETWILVLIKFIGSYSLFLGVVVRRKNRKRKNKRKARDRNILEIFEEIEENLKKKYDIGIEQLLERKKEAEKKEVEVPLSVFKESMSPAEVLCRYLRENKGLRFCEIAKILNRKENTVWTSYKNAIKKKRQRIDLRDRGIMIPIRILANRKFSILESVVKYLREKGFRNKEIAGILAKDERVVSVIYMRVKKKLNNK